MNKILFAFIFLTLLLMGGGNIYAQKTLYNEGAVIHTDRNTLIHVDGDIENKNASSLENDGVIELVGNFTNDSTAKFKVAGDTASRERAFKFVGSGTQFIYGNVSDTVDRYFYNLIIDKSASGTPVILGTNADVKGSLLFGSATMGTPTYAPSSMSTLTNNSGKGIIRTYDTSARDYELYIVNPSVDAIKGYGSLYLNNATADSFIQTRGAQGVGLGGLSRNVSALGVPYIYPIGTANNKYNPVSFNFSTLPTAVDKVRGMFVNAPGGVGQLNRTCVGCGSIAAPAGFNYYFRNNPCDSDKPQWVVFNELPKDHGYWSFDGNASDQYVMVTYPRYPVYAGRAEDIWRTVKKSGTISAVPTGDWSAEILSSVSTPNDLLSYSKNTGCFTDAGIPGGSYTGFGSYQMARQMVGGGVALPVELISLTATDIDNKLIRLNWATAQEINNKGFRVMRSIDGNDFKEIAWVDAQGGGNKSIRSDYRYDDVSAIPGITYYYRLVQEDYDGQTKETYIVQGSLMGIGNTINVSSCYPNPASSYSKITIKTTDDIELTIYIYNLEGQQLQQMNLRATSGESSLDINTEKLPSGLYSIVVRSGENVFSSKLNIIK